MSGTPRPVTPVSVLAARLDALAERAAGADVEPWLREELAAVRDLAVGLDPYVARHTSAPSPALHELARRTAAHDWAGDGHAVPLEQEMLSGHVEGQLLRMLVQTLGASDVLDLGMFTGYSSLAMAEALPLSGRVVACEVDAAVAAFARECFAASPARRRIQVRVGPALATLDALAGERARFDLVFLDADKPGYLDYYERLLEGRLLAPRGLLVVDNTLMQGEPWLGGTSANARAIAAFNDHVSADPRTEQVLLAVRDGVTLVRRVDA